MKFSYKYSRGKDEEELVNSLFKVGIDGWELVSVVFDGKWWVAFLKKSI